jgi:hypothetical protein
LSSIAINLFSLTIIIMPSMKHVTQWKIQHYIPYSHQVLYVLHANSHVSLPSYYSSTCQRMTPVIPPGLTPATLEHYLQSYALPIQPRKMPEPNRVNSMWSKVLMMMMTRIFSTINHPSIIATQLIEVMTPFLIFPTMIMTSMTTCHQISFAIRGGDNSEEGLHYFWKIFDFYLESSNFCLVF